MSNLPGHALDVQLDLARWYTSPCGVQYVVNQVKHAAALTDEDLADWNAAVFAKNYMRSMLYTGETYAVTADIVDVLEAAAPTVPDYALHETDLLSRDGFVFLERAIILDDSFGKAMAVRGFGWATAVMSDTDPLLLIDGLPPTDNNIVVTLFTDPNDERDHMSAEWHDTKSRLRTVGDPGLLSLTTGPWQFGEPSNKFDQSILLAFFRFVQEKWVDPRAVDPDRPARRRAERAGRTSPKITVVQLRRRSTNRTGDGSDGGSEIERSHRWFVRGHWRNQWYPSIQQHRPVWISEHIKGPDDKPLVADDKVFHVGR